MKNLLLHSKAILFSVGLIFLCGCYRYTPLPFDPEVELSNVEARAYQSQQVATPETQNAYFPFADSISLCNGLSLPEANSLALFYSPELLKARIEYGISTAMLIEAGFPENPQFFMGPRFNVRDGNLILPASLAFELYIVDRLSPMRAAAEWQVEKNRWLLANTEISVLARVQKGFLEVETAHQLEEVALKRSERAEKLLLWLKSLYSSGKITPYLYQVSQRESEDAKVELMNATVKRKKSQTALFKLIGLLPDANIEILFEPLPLLTLDTEAIPPSMVLAHPALKAIHVEYLASEETLRAETAKQYPAIRFGPEFEKDQGQISAGFGLGFEIPVFKLNRTGIGVAEENRNLVRNQYYDTLLNLWEMRANLQIEQEALLARYADLNTGILMDAERLDRVFSESLHATQDAILTELDAANAIARTFTEAVELRRRIGITKIDLLVTSGMLLPDYLYEPNSCEE